MVIGHWSLWSLVIMVIMVIMVIGHWSLVIMVILLAPPAKPWRGINKIIAGNPHRRESLVRVSYFCSLN